MARVAALIEQFWHRVPGGTARATFETLQELIFQSEHDYVGVSAWHSRANTPAYELDIEVEGILLPRPTLYGRWLDGKSPSLDHLVGDGGVAWASAMVVPTTTSPIVTTVHDLDFLDHPETLSKRGSRFMPRAWSAAKERSDKIVCPSKYVADSCIGQGIIASDVEVIPWGVRVEDEDTSQDWSPEVAGEFANLGLADEYFLWVGTKEPRKNLERLVQGFSSSKAKQLVLVGPKGWDLNLKDDSLEGIRLLDSVSDALLNLLYRNATAFIFPSLTEGFGLPILEAMARGLPVITSATSAMNEIANGAAELIDPTDINQIVASINRLIDNELLVEELASAGLARAAKYSWASTASSYSDVFSSLASD